MLIQSQKRRRIGQILLDGGFINNTSLERALKEQYKTNELLGQVLVSMGVLDQVEIDAALSVQEHISNMDESIRSAAGTRQFFGALLTMTGRISQEQLEHAIALQRITGEKLGEVFVRLKILNEEQRNNLLTYQQNQCCEPPAANPFRLGEILVTTRYITREQLDDALLKKVDSSKKLGEVLVEEGYAKPRHIEHGLQLQQRLIAAALAAIVAFSELTMSGCGSGAGAGGGLPANTPVVTQSSEQIAKSSYMAVSSNDLNLIEPTYYYSTANGSFWSIQANTARYAQDIDTRNIVRIDVPRINGSWPSLNKAFSIEDSPQYEKFPGTIMVLNGDESTMRKVEQGIINFAPDSVTAEHVSGHFDVTVTDYGSATLPLPQHHVKGDFYFRMGDYGPAKTVVTQL